MALDLMYDDNFDLVFPLQTVSGLDELKQSLLSVVSTNKGIFLNENVGLNHDFLLGGFSESMATNMITTALEQDDRVLKVNSVHCDVDGQTVNVTFSVDTTLGTINLKKGVGTDAING